MKKIKYLIITLSVISLILIYFYNNNRMITKASSDDENSILYLEMNDTTTEPKTIYSEKYQNKIQRQIDRAKQKNNYTFKEPLLIENPYGTNTTGVYMYFTTDEDYQATYTISCNGYEDFTQTLNTNTSSGYTKEHEYLLVGSIPGEKNIITVTLHDTQGNEVDTLTWSYQAPDLLGGNEYITVETETYDTNASLTNGLYTVLGNDVTEDSDTLAYMRLYDNYGIIRSEIPIISYRSHRCLFDDNTMYISVSSTKIVGIDQTGYVSTIYDTGDYKLHHDYIFDDNKNLIVLASKKEAETSEDKIIMIDHDSGEVSELIDLIDLFPDYYKLTSKPESADDLDWMHINSLELINDDSLIISSRETSTIIKINDIYNEPSVDYMIGSDNFWQESGYDNFLLTKANDFSLQAGQHCVTYATDSSLSDGQYYLYLYNNNIAVSTTRPDYNWKEDPNYTNVSYDSKDGVSHYYKYLIDENTKTVELIADIPAEYSGYVSSVQEIDNNVIIDSGMAMTWFEYDKSGSLIKKFTTTGGKFLHRVFKYTYNDYWFQ